MNISRNEKGAGMEWVLLVFSGEVGNCRGKLLFQHIFKMSLLLFSVTTLRHRMGQAVVAHVFRRSTWEAEAGSL